MRRAPSPVTASPRRAVWRPGRPSRLRTPAGQSDGEEGKEKKYH